MKLEEWQRRIIAKIFTEEVRYSSEHVQINGRRAVAVTVHLPRGWKHRFAEAILARRA